MAEPNTEDVVNAIAADTNAPTETISKMFADTWAEYSDGARITDYMTVLVTKRIRGNLLGVAKDTHEPATTYPEKSPQTATQRSRLPTTCAL